MTTVIEQLNEELGSRLLHSTINGEEKVHDVVESWNWNLNIFEIYDEIKEWKDNDIRNVCKYAYQYFNKDVMFNDLAYHLTGEGIK
jgi:transketolase